ncbi:aspartyl/asparaginyl beta-hydroxylase domain-containing protein [Neolewinella persica]|uniref:aspartyl/asparaginyl beta-hydroxylase domain-containing protein n=1 Tax=Neolewinella persica TaxID=70998 RepID=UPI0003764435|nr:aspartyl/asparaginyl beta-hydroxylase domain-containing protein [Neolewinella persica]
MIPDRVKLSLFFDTALLQADLLHLERLGIGWTDHFVTRNYAGSWSILPLRANRGAVHPIQQIYSDPASKDYVDTPILEHSPYLKEVLAGFHSTLYAARLMRLGTGALIKEHRDHDLDVEGGCVRLHIPILTNPKVHFMLNGQRVVMEAGECWYLRLSDPHSVWNDGPDRIHLVVDMLANDWVKEQLLIKVA